MEFIFISQAKNELICVVAQIFIKEKKKKEEENHEKLLRGRDGKMSRQQRQKHARLSLLALGEISEDIAQRKYSSNHRLFSASVVVVFI